MAQPAITSRATLATGTTYNLYTLLTNTTHSGIMSKQFTAGGAAVLPYFARTIYLEKQSGGIAYLATDSDASSTHHFRALVNDQETWTERMELANACDLSEIYIRVSANDTIIGIRVDFF